MLVTFAAAGMLERVQQLVTQLTDNGRQRPTPRQHEQLIRAALATNSRATAQQYLIDAAADLPPPQVDVYNTLLRCCVLLQDRHRFARLMEEMRRNQVPADDHTQELIAELAAQAEPPAATTASVLVGTA